MSNVSEILEEIEAEMGATNGMTVDYYQFLERIQALLSSHAVIDKETAETGAETARDELRRTEGVSGMEYLERAMIDFRAELSRLSTTHKGE